MIKILMFTSNYLLNLEMKCISISPLKPMKKLNSAFKDSINEDKGACEVRRYFPLNLGRPRLSWLNAISFG